MLPALSVQVADALTAALEKLLRGLEADQGRARDKNNRESIRDAEQP